MNLTFTQKITTQFLDKKRHISDPEADTAIHALVEKYGSREAKKIFDLLIHDVDLPIEKLPNSLQDFITKNSEIPIWMDGKKINTATELFIDHGPKFLLFLYFKSLPLLYSMKNGVQVLAQTGRLAHNQKSNEIFTRRIAETGQFLLEVMQPDGFKGEKRAVTSALKIRLIHAAIRNFISNNDWDEKKLGKPINQEDLAATLMTFGVTMTNALSQFNINVTEDEKKAYIHYWNVIGHIMGIDDDIMPQTVDDANFLLNVILERQSSFSEEGVLLTKALTGFVQSKIDSGLLKKSPNVLIRFMVGDEIAEKIGVRKNKLWWLYKLIPAFLKSWFGFGEKLEDRVKVLEKFADKTSQKLVKALVGYFDKYKERKFYIPDKLKSNWDIS